MVMSCLPTTSVSLVKLAITSRSYYRYLDIWPPTAQYYHPATISTSSHCHIITSTTSTTATTTTSTISLQRDRQPSFSSVGWLNCLVCETDDSGTVERNVAMVLLSYLNSQLSTLNIAGITAQTAQSSPGLTDELSARWRKHFSLVLVFINCGVNPTDKTAKVDEWR